MSESNEFVATGTSDEIRIKELFITKVEIPNAHIDTLFEIIRDLLPTVVIEDKVSRELSRIFWITVSDEQSRMRLTKLLYGHAEAHNLKCLYLDKM
jgi:hypothetical protein